MWHHKSFKVMQPNPPNKILYVIPSLDLGGAEYETIDQVNYLYKKNYDVFILVLSNKTALSSKLELPKSRIIILNLENLTTTRFKNITKFPSALKDIQKVVKTNKITTVIAVLPLCHLLMRLHKLGNKTDYKLWCFHKSMQYQATPLNTLPKKIVHRFNKNLSTKYDYGHIFISEAVKKNIAAHLNIKNGFVLHNAVHTRVVSPDLAEEYLTSKNIDLPSYLVVFPGRLHATKGHDFFIKSLSDYLKELVANDLKVMFVGGGPLKSKIQNTIKEANLEAQIILTDYVDNTLLLSFLALANLVVIPSIHEGFGNVAIEALMQGSTILASNTGGLPEIINHGTNGYLFNRLNTADLRLKFINLHTEKKKLDSKLLKADFQQRFTIDAQMHKLIKIIS